MLMYELATLVFFCFGMKPPTPPKKNNNPQQNKQHKINKIQYNNTKSL